MAELTEFSVGQGETFRALTSITNTRTGLPLDITDYVFTGQVRENYTTDEVAATFNVIKLAPYNSGSFIVELTNAQTLLLTQRKYVYDIKISSGSTTPVVRNVLEGPFTVRPTATR